MAHRYRDPLAKTRRENTADRMRHQREAMTTGQVKEAMALVIRARLELGETVSLDDFRRANLPIDVVQAVFPAVLAGVRMEMRR